MEQNKIEIIFDRTHGTRNYGWYARETDADGHQEETQIPEDWSEDASVSDGVILAWATTYFADPDGMTDAELQDLRRRIEVKR
jgi:hypothetical protein